MDFLKDFVISLKAFIPIFGALLIYRVIVSRSSFVTVLSEIAMVAISATGLFLFLKGINFSLLPIGEEVGRGMAGGFLGIVIIIIVMFFAYGTTVLEPGLQSLAFIAEENSIGIIRKNVLINAVALGYLVGIALGLARVAYQIPITYIVAPLLVLIGVLMMLVQEHVAALAMDCASATTGPVNIPFVLALAAGLSKRVSGSDPLVQGFGLVGITSLSTAVSVLILGLIFLRK